MRAEAGYSKVAKWDLGSVTIQQRYNREEGREDDGGKNGGQQGTPEEERTRSFEAEEASGRD